MNNKKKYVYSRRQVKLVYGRERERMEDETEEIRFSYLIFATLWNFAVNRSLLLRFIASDEFCLRIERNENIRLR